eukprot:Pgem_evm1s2548
MFISKKHSSYSAIEEGDNPKKPSKSNTKKEKIKFYRNGPILIPCLLIPNGQRLSQNRFNDLSITIEKFNSIEENFKKGYIIADVDWLFEVPGLEKFESLQTRDFNLEMNGMMWGSTCLSRIDFNNVTNGQMREKQRVFIKIMNPSENLVMQALTMCSSDSMKDCSWSAYVDGISTEDVMGTTMHYSVKSNKNIKFATGAYTSPILGTNNNNNNNNPNPDPDPNDNTVSGNGSGTPVTPTTPTPTTPVEIPAATTTSTNEMAFTD